MSRPMSAVPKSKAVSTPARRARASRNGEERSSLFVGSVEKAFQVLEAFRDTHRSMSMAELARAAPMVPVTPYTETDTKLLLARIEEAARTGYSIVINQTLVGDISVAAPITDHHGHPVAAINVAVPTTRWTVEKAEELLVPHVLLAATSISQAKMPRA
jgi:DNA-binding IclR family transcriptional regulator